MKLIRNYIAIALKFVCVHSRYVSRYYSAKQSTFSTAFIMIPYELSNTCIRIGSDYSIPSGKHPDLHFPMVCVFKDA